MTLPCTSTTEFIPHCRPSINETDIAAVEKVMKSGQLACGSVCKEFEAALAERLGWKHACVVSSGTSSLVLSLNYLPHIYTVILPPYACNSILLAAWDAQAPIKFGKTNAVSWCLGIHEQREDLGSLLVHTYGVVDSSLIDQSTIEDATMAIGARGLGKRKGRSCVISFYATKMLCCGEGGVILTDDEKGDSLCRERRDCRKLVSSKQSNYKMTDMEAALGLSQLTRLDSFVNAREEIANVYNEAIQKRGLLLPPQTMFPGSAYGRYVILIPNRDHVRKEMKKLGIECGIGLEEPLDKPLAATCSVAKALCESSISLPIYPDLGEKKAKRIISTLLELIP